MLILQVMKPRDYVACQDPAGRSESGDSQAWVWLIPWVNPGSLKCNLIMIFLNSGRMLSIQPQCTQGEVCRRHGELRFPT